MQRPDASPPSALDIQTLPGYPGDASMFLAGRASTPWLQPPGTELDYAQITSTVTGITATTEGTAVTLITGNSVIYDGSRVRIEFFFPITFRSDATGTVQFSFVVIRDTTVVGQIPFLSGVTASPDAQGGGLFDTPTAGAHTYKVSGFLSVNAGTEVIGGGTGGTGNKVPAFLRVTKA